MAKWKDEYDREYKDKEQQIFDLNTKIRAAKKKLAETQTELDVLIKQSVFYDQLNSVRTATYFVEKVDYEIISKNDSKWKTYTINIDFESDIIESITYMDYSVIVCQSEQDAKTKLAEYIEFQLQNDLNWNDIYRILIAINKYDLTINSIILEKLKADMNDYFINKLNDALADFIDRLNNIKKASIDHFSMISHQPVEIISSVDRLIPKVKEVFVDTQ